MSISKKLYRLAIFLLCIILGQKLFVIFFPYGEFIGLKASEWATWFLHGQLFLLNLFFGVLVCITCFFMVWKLSWVMNVITGVLIGAYLSVLFYPYDSKSIVEEFVLPANSSIWTVVALYVIIIFILSALFVIVAQKIDKQTFGEHN